MRGLRTSARAMTTSCCRASGNAPAIASIGKGVREIRANTSATTSSGVAALAARHICDGTRRINPSRSEEDIVDHAAVRRDQDFLEHSGEPARLNAEGPAACRGRACHRA